MLATTIGRSLIRRHLCRTRTTTTVLVSSPAQQHNNDDRSASFTVTNQPYYFGHRSFASSSSSTSKSRGGGKKNVRRGKHGKILPTKRKEKMLLEEQQEQEENDNHDDDDDADVYNMTSEEARAEAERRSEEAAEYIQRAQRDKAFMNKVMKEWEDFKDQHPQVREMEREGIDPWDIDPDDVQITTRLRETDKDMKELLQEPPSPEEVAEANAFYKKHGYEPDDLESMRHVSDAVEDEGLGGKEAEEDAEKLLEEYRELRERMGLPKDDVEMEELANEARERMEKVKAKEERMMNEEVARRKEERKKSAGASPASMDKISKSSLSKKSSGKKTGSSVGRTTKETSDGDDEKFSKYFPPPVDLRAGTRKQKLSKGDGGSNNNKKKKKKKKKQKH